MLNHDLTTLMGQRHRPILQANTLLLFIFKSLRTLVVAASVATISKTTTSDGNSLFKITIQYSEYEEREIVSDIN